MLMLEGSSLTAFVAIRADKRRIAPGTFSVL